MTETHEVCRKRDYPAQGWKEARRTGDYAYARSLAKRPRPSGHLERGYKIACHFAEVMIAGRRRDEGEALEELFRQHAERWINETAHLSSVTRMISHSSYLRIIGFGRDGLPFILRELRARPDHWLVALNAITGEDPAPEGANFRDAVAAWIKWGEIRGYC